MIKKTHKKYIFSIIIILVLGWFYGPTLSDIVFPKTDTVQIISGKNTHSFDVELALTKQQQADGLMHRETIGENEGMLFIFNEPSISRFWMKDTKIPLDIIFINESHIIVQIDRNRQPFDTTPSGPEQPVVAVLEVKGGRSKELGIRVGDRISGGKYFAPQN